MFFTLIRECLFSKNYNVFGGKALCHIGMYTFSKLLINLFVISQKSCLFTKDFWLNLKCIKDFFTVQVTMTT